jgi:hypothetical protein
MSDYKKGDLVTFHVIGRHYSEDGLGINVNMRTHSHKVLTLCENINLENFPSFNDFTGKHIEVTHGDMAIILKKVGRPEKISEGKKWNAYDVYQVMTTSLQICQVFRYHIDKIN